MNHFKSFIMVIAAMFAAGAVYAETPKLVLKDPLTEEHASISLMMITPQHIRPLAAVFPSGKCYWSQEFIDGRRIDIYGSSANRDQNIAQDKLRTQEIIDIINLEYHVNKKSLDEVSGIVSRSPIVQDRDDSWKTLSFQVGELQEQERSKLYEMIHKTQVFKNMDDGFGGELVVTFNHGGYLEELTGPMIRKPIPLDDTFTWTSRNPFEENWLHFVSLILWEISKSTHLGEEEVLLNAEFLGPFVDEDLNGLSRAGCNSIEGQPRDPGTQQMSVHHSLTDDDG